MRLVLVGAVCRAMVRRRAAMVVGAVVTAFVIGAPAAIAATATPTTLLGAFAGPGTADGQLNLPTHIAVEPTTGNVLVADSGNGRVQVFAPGTGASASFLTSFGPGTLTTPVGLAVDQVTGAVYVSDSGANQIFRFTSDGATTPTYTADPGFVSPTLGAGAGQVGSFASAIAIDPASHDLLVADSGNKRVDRFTSAGSPVATFIGAASVSGAFTIPLSIAVAGTGTIYVVDAEGDTFYDPGLSAGAPSHLRRFTAAGVDEGEVAGITTPSAVAADPATNEVVASGDSAYDTPGGFRRIYRFASDNTLLGVVDLAPDTANQFPAGIRSVAVEAAAPGRIYALGDQNFAGGGTYGTVSVQVVRRTFTPGIDIGPTTAVGTTTAHVSAVVAPGGDPTTAHLEYSMNGTDWTLLPDHAGLVGAGEQTIGDDVTGLRPNTTYSVRARAANVFFSSISGLGTFHTGGVAPVVVTTSVSDLGSTAATLTGRLTAFGLQSTFAFEYGETTDYGRRAPVGVAGVAGNGFAPRALTRTVSDLKPGTVYHYRLVGTNAAGTAYGDDKSFTTDTVATTARAYEMVSPIGKEGVPVDTSFLGTASSPDGNGILYGSGKTVFPGSSVAPLVARVVAHRSADGWTNAPTDLPLDAFDPTKFLFYSTLTFSQDLGQGLVLSNRKLTSDAVEGAWNLYRRDPLGASPTADHLTLVGSGSKLTELAHLNSQFNLIGASADQRKFFFTDDQAGMWEASGGTIRPVSVLPDGTTAPDAGAIATLDDPHQVSEDGSRVFFTAVDSPAAGLYLRENGTTTVPISVSHRPGAPATPVGARFAGATPDGRYVMFVTATTFTGTPGLTPDAPDVLPGQLGNLYRYDVDTDTMTFVASDVSFTEKLVAMPATGEAYYQSPVNPTGAPGARPYLLHAGNGPTTLVAGLGDDDGAHPRTLFNGKTSPSGRYFAFVSRAPLTAYDNDGGEVCHALREAEFGGGTFAPSLCNEVYLYDSHTRQLTCPSCRTDGGRPTGDARNGQIIGGGTVLNRYLPRSVLDDGTVFFDTPDPLVAADANGSSDVYSWRNGRATLITRGSQPAASTFLDATPDGSNVFFATDERLVGQDRDDTVDLYDARVGGGIAAQSPGPGPAPCTADECREASRGLVAPDPPASQSGQRAPMKPKPAAKGKVSVLRSSFGATTLTVTVQVSGGGRIRASGATIQATTRTAAKAGAYTLKVPLTRKTRAARKARRRVKVTVKVSLTPPFAAPTSTKLTRTLGK